LRELDDVVELKGAAFPAGFSWAGGTVSWSFGCALGGIFFVVYISLVI
jgi:hypothetical protein